jgi:protein involved in plasmid replication-relaxation
VDPIPGEDLRQGALGLGLSGLRALRLLEPTPAGRRELARRLALPGPVAARRHGLVGGERGRAGKRRRALRTLAHTLGTNAVFVAMVLAARAVRQGGGDDRLQAWWGAAAYERRRCRPDGYGLYWRAGRGYGFLLEYDRGTERPDQLARKFAAYASFRDRGEVARDFTSFPTILVVTTSAAAEHRLADAAYRVWWRQQDEPLPVLLTTTDRIAAHREGILGPVWRTPGRTERRYWLPGGPPRGLFGVGRPAVPTPQLVWATR